MEDNLFDNPWMQAMLNSSLATPPPRDGSPLAPPRPFRGAPDPFQFNATASLSPLLQALPPGTLQRLLQTLHPQLEMNATSRNLWDAPPFSTPSDIWVRIRVDVEAYTDKGNDVPGDRVQSARGT